MIHGELTEEYRPAMKVQAGMLQGWGNAKVQFQSMNTVAEVGPDIACVSPCNIQEYAKKLNILAGPEFPMAFALLPAPAILPRIAFVM